MGDNTPLQRVAKRVTNAAGLAKLEKLYRRHQQNELNPLARGASYTEIAQVSVPDRDGDWVHPVNIYVSYHNSKLGIVNVAKMAMDYLYDFKKDNDLDVLSVSTGITESSIELICLVRFYALPITHAVMCAHIDNAIKPVRIETRREVDDCPKFTQEEIARHYEVIRRQDDELVSSSLDAPFLNKIESYTRQDLSHDYMKELYYDLRTRDMQMNLVLKYEDFIVVFRECMQYITSSLEREQYYDVMREKMTKVDFMRNIESYIRRRFINQKKLPEEDLPALIAKLDRALFQLYIVQDLIDDPDITDVKITAYDSIRVRIHGKAMLSNVTFIDQEDYERFIVGLAVKNNVDLKIPSQTFTDDHDTNYILRFSIFAPYITGSGAPIIHIRKVARKKLLADDLIKAGMMDEKIRDYLLDCGKYSRGVVFAGPPGSGKTVMLNWFLEEAYEQSAEILVIQENDELFCYRKGVMFEHVVTNPQKGERATTLEDLGQMALVAGANVFVIGEAKGGEICSAITLSNSGCRTAITIHSNSSTETLDKMADLAMRGYATSYDQAKRMLKSFETIVYLRDFKVQEISQIIGYDDDKRDMVYRPIYRRKVV